MHDKVLGFIRETQLHENLVESLSVDLLAGEVRLNLLQPSPKFNEYPEPELLLTFSGVLDFSVRDVGTGGRYGDDVVGLECSAEVGRYQAVITVGHPEFPSWSILLTFADLRYKRSRPGS